MFNFDKIYFDGNSYAEWLKNNKDVDVIYTEEEYLLALKNNMKVVDCIDFVDLNYNYCDIRIDHVHFFGVSKNYLVFTTKDKYLKLNKSLEEKMSSKPNPGGLY